MKRKLLSLVLSAALVLSMAACGNDDSQSGSSTPQNSDDSTQTPLSNEGSSGAEDSSASDTSSEDVGGASGETVVIRYGSHNIDGLDPYHTDDVTGDYTMEEQKRQAAIAGLAAIKEAYNVEFEFLVYPVDVQSDLMTSVMAGDPICDLALLWGGVEPNILAQNVLQDLSAYKSLFEDEKTSWMLKDEMFGGYYLLNNEFLSTYFPLVVNMTMLEAVDSLKDADGNTIYPTDLIKNGEWTWSKFEEYLEKINAYYANIEANSSAEYDYVQAYETDSRYAALAAVHANGGAVYADGNVTADSEEVIEAVQYIERLMDKGLLTECGVYDDGYTPKWTKGAEDFGYGATVFTDCANWNINWEASQRAEDNQSIGIIPWPRPDDMDQDDPNYMQSTNGGNSVAVLKGVSPEKTELALKSYILYWETYYQVLGNVESASEYQKAAALADLANYGVDVYNEKYGDDLIDCYNYILDHTNMNYAHMLGLWQKDGSMWSDILEKSLHNVDGMSSYDVAIKANISNLTNVTDEIAAILKTDEVHDNQAPSVTTENAVIAAGTAADSVDWTQYFTAEDAVDGTIAVTADHITVSEELDLTTPGIYEKAVTAKVSDASGNEKSGNIKVTVYNPDNTEAPAVEVAEELPEVALDTDTSGIDWTKYLASATDADGVDVKSNVTADLSELDTTTPGTYNVILTVTDYAGNTSEVTVAVTVAAAE